ncbi:MAG: 50S ribosomal protein L9 [Patescibacteria group bacterium]
MKIILLKDVSKVGKRYDIKNISDGYAVNLLIPRGFAIPATADAIKRVELERLREEGEKKVHQELLLKNASELEGITVTITEKANEKSHLFAAVHKPEIIKAIEDQTRLQIDSEHIELEKHIKEIGIHEISIKVGGKKIKFNLDIKAK